MRISCSSVVLSAKISIEDLDGCGGVSLTNKRSKIGRNTERYGTPCFIVSGSDLSPLLVTNCFLSERYDVNQESVSHWLCRALISIIKVDDQQRKMPFQSRQKSFR